MSIITSIVGARPQFIKAAMLSSALSAHDEVQEVLLHTGQHYDANMSAIFFDELKLPKPAYNLGIHKATHGEMTGAMLIGIERVFFENKPDLVVVFGDTDSTLAGALAAAKMGIPIAHVEAGLRSFNRSMPEEINRVLTDHLSELLFAPTPTAVKNLRDENRPEKGIIHSGDIMFDAAIQACAQVDENTLLKKYEITPKSYTLVTLHRAENTDCPERLRIWLGALNEAAAKSPILFPIHPRTRQRMDDYGMSFASYPSIQFIEPVGYSTMAVLTKNARLVATDSGGLQKEAYFHKVPGLILRNETEWVELVESGWSTLIECERDIFLKALHDFRAPEAWEAHIFGTGQSAKTIVKAILDYLK